MHPYTDMIWSHVLLPCGIWDNYQYIPMPVTGMIKLNSSANSADQVGNSAMIPGMLCSTLLGSAAAIELQLLSACSGIWT